jgi:hypothetical protein
MLPLLKVSLERSSCPALPPKALAPLLNFGLDSSFAGLGAKALTSLVLQLSMMVSMDVISLLEGIDTSMSAPLRLARPCALSGCSPTLLCLLVPCSPLG